MSRRHAQGVSAQLTAVTLYDCFGEAHSTMEYLASMQPFLAQALVDKLHEAGIAAESTEFSGPGAGSWVPGLTNFAYTVWVLDPADLEEARRLLKELNDVPKESEFCDSCGYNLKGHAGEEACPECGAAVLVADPETWWVCEICGESSPPNASECWKCAQPGSAEPALQPERPSPENRKRGNRIVFLIFLLFMASLLFMAFLRAGGVLFSG